MLRKMRGIFWHWKISQLGVNIFDQGNDWCNNTLMYVDIELHTALNRNQSRISTRLKHILEALQCYRREYLGR